MHHLGIPLARTFGMPGVELDKAIQRLADQQRTPLMLRITLGTTKHDTWHAHAELFEAVQCIELAQHRRPAEWV